MLSHLSSDCNSPDIASRRIGDTLQQQGLGNVDVRCADQHEPTGWIEILSNHQTDPPQTPNHVS